MKPEVHSELKKAFMILVMGCWSK